MTMENDLVERLDKMRWDFHGELCAEAANRIQALEAELAQTKKERNRYLMMLESAEKLSAALGIDTHGAAVDVAVRFLKEKRVVEAELARKTEALEFYRDAWEPSFTWLAAEAHGMSANDALLADKGSIARSALEKKINGQ